MALSLSPCGSWKLTFTREIAGSNRSFLEIFASKMVLQNQLTVN